MIFYETVVLTGWILPSTADPKEGTDETSHLLTKTRIAEVFPTVQESTVKSLVFLEDPPKIKICVLIKWTINVHIRTVVCNNDFWTQHIEFCCYYFTLHYAKCFYIPDTCALWDWHNTATDAEPTSVRHSLFAYCWLYSSLLAAYLVAPSWTLTRCLSILNTQTIFRTVLHCKSTNLV